MCYFKAILVMKMRCIASSILVALSLYRHSSKVTDRAVPVLHDTTLLTALGAAFVPVFDLRYHASLARQPPSVGYPVAGMAIGPYAPDP